MDHTFPVEPNTNFQVTAGDVLENQPYSDVLQGLDHNVMDFLTQTSASNLDIIHFDQFNGFIPPSMIWQFVAYQADPLSYKGLGGTKLISAHLFGMTQNTMPFDKLWNNIPAPNTSAFSFQNCLYGCADSRSTFDWLTIPTQFGQGWRETIHQDTGMMRYTSNSASANYFKEQSPAGEVTLVDAGSSVGRAFHIVQPNLVESIAGDPALSSTEGAEILTTQQWSVNVPASAPSITLSGTPFIATGTASNTDVAGELTFSATTTATYTWLGTYTSHPEVTGILPQMDIGSGNHCWVTYTGVTSFTINCASAVTGSISYGAIGRN